MKEVYFGFMGMADGVFMIAGNTSLPQGPHKLRCPPSKLPVDRLRYCVAGQEESEHLDTMRYV